MIPANGNATQVIEKEKTYDTAKCNRYKCLLKIQPNEQRKRKCDEVFYGCQQKNLNDF